MAVRRHLGQPRVLLAGLAEHRQGGRLRAAGPDRQGRRQPGVVRIPAGARDQADSTSLETFDPPAVKDVPIERFDATGLGEEPNNRIAIDSLKAYRAMRYGGTSI